MVDTIIYNVWWKLVGFESLQRMDACETGMYVKMAQGFPNSAEYLAAIRFKVQCKSKQIGY